MPRHSSHGPGKGPGWGGPAKGAAPKHFDRPEYTADNARGMQERGAALRGTPECIARNELRQQRRDLAEAVVFEVMLDSDQDMARLTAANSLIDRVDGKAVARVETSGPGGQPMEHVVHARRSPVEIIAEHSAKRKPADK